MYMQCWMESRQAVYILYIIGFPFSFIVKSLCTLYFAHAQWVTYKTLSIEKCVLGQASLPKKATNYVLKKHICIPISTTSMKGIFFELCSTL